MSNVADLKHATLRGLGFSGMLNEMEIAFFKSKGATSGQYNEAKMQWLVVKGQTSGAIDDRENKYLASLGYSGSRDDKMYAALTAGTYYA